MGMVGQGDLEEVLILSEGGSVVVDEEWSGGGKMVA